MITDFIYTPFLFSTCERVVNTAAAVIGKPIHFEFNDIEQNYVTVHNGKNSSDGYKITVARNARLTEPYTSTEHEISHLLFKTPMITFQKIIEKLLNRDGIRNGLVRDQVIKFLHDYHNVIEDQRIESLYGSIYYGSLIRFIRMRKGFGAILSKNAENILMASYCARVYREDLIPEKFKEAIEINKAVELSGPSVPMFYTKYVYEKYLKKEALEAQEKLKDLSAEYVKAYNSCFESGKTDIEQHTEKKALDAKYNDDQKKVSARLGEKTESEKGPKTDRAPDLDFETKETFEDLDAVKDAIGFVLESKEEQEKLTKKISKKIHESEIRKNGLLAKLNLADCKEIKRKKEAVTLDKKQIARIKKIFNEIQGAKKASALSDDGADFDIDQLIDRRYTFTNEIYEDDHNTIGFDLVIMADLSGSMNGQPEELQRNIIATIIHAINGIKTINWLVIGWASDDSTKDSLRTSTIRRIGDLGHLCVDVVGQNINHIAHQYGHHVINKMKNKKKMIIFVTDGQPHGQTKFSRSELVDLAGLATQAARDDGIEFIGIGTNSGLDHKMKAMFGKDFILCEEIGKLSGELEKIIGRVIKDAS